MYRVMTGSGWKFTNRSLGMFASKDEARSFLRDIYSDLLEPMLLVSDHWTFKYEEGMDSNSKHYVWIEEA